MQRCHSERITILPKRQKEAVPVRDEKSQEAKREDFTALPAFCQPLAATLKVFD